MKSETCSTALLAMLILCVGYCKAQITCDELGVRCNTTMAGFGCCPGLACTRFGCDNSNIRPTPGEDGDDCSGWRSCRYPLICNRENPRDPRGYCGRDSTPSVSPTTSTPTVSPTLSPSSQTQSPSAASPTALPTLRPTVSQTISISTPRQTTIIELTTQPITTLAQTMTPPPATRPSTQRQTAFPLGVTPPPPTLPGPTATDNNGNGSTTTIVAIVCIVVVVVLLLLLLAILIRRRRRRRRGNAHGQRSSVVLKLSHAPTTGSAADSVLNSYEIPTSFNPNYYGSKGIVPPVYTKVSASGHADLSGSEQTNGCTSPYDTIDERSRDYLHVLPTPAGGLQAYASLEEHQLYRSAPRPDADADYQDRKSVV